MCGRTGSKFSFNLVYDAKKNVAIYNITNIEHGLYARLFEVAPDAIVEGEKRGRFYSSIVYIQRVFDLVSVAEVSIFVLGIQSRYIHRKLMGVSFCLYLYLS